MIIPPTLLVGDAVGDPTQKQIQEQVAIDKHGLQETTSSGLSLVIGDAFDEKFFTKGSFFKQFLSHIIYKRLNMIKHIGSGYRNGPCYH
jgi:hypothetical protein